MIVVECLDVIVRNVSIWHLCVLAQFSMTSYVITFMNSIWVFHEETFQNLINKESQVAENIDKMINVWNDFKPDVRTSKNMDDDVKQGAMESTYYFEDLLTKIETILYLGCTKFSLLNFLVKLMHLKVLNKWINNTFDSVLKLLRDASPNENRLLVSHYN